MGKRKNASEDEAGSSSDEEVGILSVPP